MIDAPLWLWPVLAGLLLCSGLCSASETALFSLTPQERARARRSVQVLLERPQDLLVAVLLANLVVNILYFAFSARLVVRTEAYGDLIHVLGVLVVLLIFGEILPKTLGLGARLWIAPAVAGPLRLIVGVVGPLRRGLGRVLEFAARAAGAHQADEDRLTAEELAEVLERAADRGALVGTEADLLPEVIELRGVRVREIMVPRVDAMLLEQDGGNREALVLRALTQRVSWLPVIGEGPDDVLGRVRVRDLVLHPGEPISTRLEPVFFVPEVASVLDLLQSLRERSATEAVVVDEWGGTAGIVTLEDVFEQLLGDLRVEGEPRERAVIPQGEGVFRIAGGLSVRDFNDAFGHRVVPLEFETVGGFVTALLGRIPRTGDRVRYGRLVLEVQDARRRRVQWVDTWVEEEQPGEVFAGSEGSA